MMLKVTSLLVSHFYAAFWKARVRSIGWESYAFGLRSSTSYISFVYSYEKDRVFRRAGRADPFLWTIGAEGSYALCSLLEPRLETKIP